MDAGTGVTSGPCPKCGATVRSDQPFCSECGTDLRAGRVETAEMPPPQPAAAAAPLPPSPVAPTPGPRSAASAPATTAPPWPAWLGAAASGVAAVATALPWLGGSGGADAFQIPLAALWSDTAATGPPIAIPLLVVAGVGLAFALVSPMPGRLGIAFLATGGLATLLLLWYVLRVLRLASSIGGGFFDAVSFGVWIAAAGSLGIFVAGLMLGLGRRTSTA